MLGVQLWAEAVDFSSVTVSRLAVTSTQTSIEWVLRIKWLQHEADHSPPSSDKVECVKLYLHSPICLHGMLLNEAETILSLLY